MKTHAAALFVFASMHASTALAQRADPIERTVHQPSGEASEQAATPGTALALDALCDAASVSETATSFGVGTTVTCRVDRRGDLALVSFHFDGGGEGWLARVEGDVLRIVARIDECTSGDESECNIVLHALRRRTLGARRIVEIETENVYDAQDFGEPAVGVERYTRSLSVCVVDDSALGASCGYRHPIRVRVVDLDFTGHFENGAILWTGHVTRQRVSMAAAQVRADGTLALRLQSGTWETLFRDAFDRSEEPDDDARSTTLRWLPDPE
jgi:hypothetical protein